MANPTQIEFLAAVLSGSKRRPIQALVTEIYVMIEGDFLNVTHAANVPIDGTTSYIDQQAITLDFTFELDEVVVVQNQAPDVLSSNMETLSGTSIVITVTEVEQDQFPDILSSNMETLAGTSVVITVTEVTQDQLPDTLNSNMETLAGTVTVE